MISQDTICAKSTAQGQSALGIIRISGRDAIEVVRQIFKGKDLAQAPSHTVHYGFVWDDNRLIDEVLVSVFRAPKTFTREDLVEISCHGSAYIQEEILTLLTRKGARMADPGEFTQRAFLNGRIDLSQAEAIADLITAENKASHDMALNQMRGGVSNELQVLREQLIHFTAMIELELDFSEEDVEFAERTELHALVQTLKQKIQSLIHSFEYGNALKNGVPVAIVGKPNAGKSSLLNVLLNEERAIVSSIPGTTRDTIEEQFTLGGIGFRFIDTAGLRETTDEIEAIGVGKAREKIEQSKIILYLFDREDTDQNEVLEQLQQIPKGKKVFLVSTKNDRHPNHKGWEEQLDLHAHLFESLVSISSKAHSNIDLLKTHLLKAAQQGADNSAVIITNIRHKEALNKALEALQHVEEGMLSGLTGDLLAFHLKDSLRHLGSITGEIEIDKDILGTIFGSFCIGK